MLGRRVKILAGLVADRLPARGRVLDVGAGDGALAERVRGRLPGIEVTGVDILVRPATSIPVGAYDGVTLPFDDDGFDAVMLIDVLHHAEDAPKLLREAARVAPVIVVKDHLADGLLAVPTLRLMDWVGNAHHGVDLRYAYWRREQWNAALEAAGLQAVELDDDLPLYPPPFSWIFGRRLHFITRLERV